MLPFGGFGTTVIFNFFVLTNVAGWVFSSAYWSLLNNWLTHYRYQVVGSCIVTERLMDNSTNWCLQLVTYAVPCPTGAKRFHFPHLWKDSQFPLSEGIVMGPYEGFLAVIFICTFNKIGWGQSTVALWTKCIQKCIWSYYETSTVRMNQIKFSRTSFVWLRLLKAD